MRIAFLVFLVLAAIGCVSGNLVGPRAERPALAGLATTG
jgi:hypothetical protein